MRDEHWSLPYLFRLRWRAPFYPFPVTLYPLYRFDISLDFPPRSVPNSAGIPSARAKAISSNYTRLRRHRFA